MIRQSYPRLCLPGESHRDTPQRVRRALDRQSGAEGEQSTRPPTGAIARLAPCRSRRRSRGAGRMVSFGALVLWTLLVLYPNPAPLIVSLRRAWSPVVDPAAVRDLAAALPDDPRAVE